MLDPLTPGYFSTEDIKVYYVIDGQRIPYPHKSTADTTGFNVSKGIYTDDGSYSMEVESNDNIKNGEAVTILEFVNTEIDTILCRYSRHSKKSPWIRDGVIFNGKLVQAEFTTGIETFDIVIGK